MADLRFQPWQFDNAPHAVHVRRDAAGDFISSGLDWNDAQRCQIEHRAFAPWRWYQDPEWTRNEGKIAEVLVAYVESRAMIHHVDTNQPLEVRFRLAQDRLRKQSVYLREVIERMRSEFLRLSAERPENMPRISTLRRELCIYQCQLRLVETAPEKLAGIIWLYFRVGHDAHSVGQQLAMLHPHVRQCLTRLRDRAEALGFTSRVPLQHSQHRWRCRATKPMPKKKPVRANFVEGLGIVEIIGHLGDQVRIKALGCEMTVHKLRLPAELLDPS